MQMSRDLAAAVTIFLTLIVSSAVDAKGEIQLFNGTDLSGWTKRGGAATYAVENGEVVGRSAPNTTNTFLCTDKEFGDFELDFDFEIDEVDFNSGVQLRSHARPEGDQKRVYGYQFEIDPKPRAWTGGIYFEGGSKDGNGKWIRKGEWLDDLSKNEPARKAFQLGKWNHGRVIAKGRHIQTWVNDVPAADYTDDDEKAFTPSGFVALQVHSVGGSQATKEVRWKNIKVKTL
jgi:hypothetical protein